MNIIPLPKEILTLNGSYRGGAALSVGAKDFDRFAIAWKTFLIDARPDESAGAALSFYTDPALSQEEYELYLGETAIQIHSSGNEGAFRALATLKQILAQSVKEEIPCLKIHDKPDIPMRGLMITVPESTIPRMDYLYRLVDLLALLKYNAFQLYFDSVVFEYDSLRKFEEGKTCISQEEIHALDLYCRERHIELMANQEVLGHMGSWLRYDELKELAIQVDDRPLFTLNPLSEKSLAFARQLLDDLLPHYTSAHVHIGMDECYGLGRFETEAYCKTFGEGRLLAEYIGKISNYIKDKYHKRSMLWGDYVVKYRDALKYLPKDVMIVDWGYELGHSFDRNILACQEQGLDVIVSPGTQTWGGISGRTDVMIQNIFEAAEAARFHGIKGFLLTDWAPGDFKLTGELAYAFGGAFAWNAGYNNSIAESGNESNCRYRNKIVHAVLKFFDEMVLKSNGKRSCAEIIYKLGNYYHFEQPDSVATWNGTQLYNTLFARGLKDVDLAPEALLDIIAYMRRLAAQIDECALDRGDEKALKQELALEIDTVIAAAQSVGLHNAKGGKWEKEFTASDAEALLSRRLANSRRYNRPAQKTEEALTRFYQTIREYGNA